MHTPIWTAPSVFLKVVCLVITVLQTVQARPRNHILRFETDTLIRNCRDIQRDNSSQVSGVYTICPYDCCPYRPVQVYCDMETNGGGWTVIQRREALPERENFDRTLMEYILGFGNLKEEFWLGLDHIHALTHQTFNEIRFDLQDFENATCWAEYKFFHIGDASESHKLQVNGYQGDAQDAFSHHNGMLFSAKDADRDALSNSSCAVGYKGGWWYNKCYLSNLNGFYHTASHPTLSGGINWIPWKGKRYSLQKTEMKIRPAY